MAPKVIVITGPTATGKTRLSIELCRRFDGEVISADSMQIYRRMDIGTAKPDEAEKMGIPHHMLDVAEPGEQYSVSKYVEAAAACVDDVLARGKIPVIAGGTGLYIDSLLSGRDFAPVEEHGDVRREISDKYDDVGGEEMLRRLGEFDPEAAGRIKPNDKKRIIRAFEVWLTSGKTITQHNAETRATPPRYDAAKIALSFKDRAELYDRINRRVDIMLERGLLDEVRQLLESGVPEKCTAMQAIGYKELIPVVKGEAPLDAAVEKIKQESRRYAKRQLSWFRRDESLHWILWDSEPDFEAGLQDSTGFLEKSGIITP
jgi:tRNA dimethylallyltransferase